MTFAHLILATAVSGIALSVIMAGAADVRRRTGNSGWVDVVWTFGLGGVGAALALAPGGEAWLSRQALVAGVVLVWSLRLGSHLVRRTRSIDDDPRYAELARQWGIDAPRRMFVLLEMQALASLPLAVSVYLAAHHPAPAFRLEDLLGLVLAVAAIAGETAADRQLRACRQSQPRGTVCQAGLWAWTRHPNYFFEWLGWVAIAVIGFDFSGAYPWGWLALAAPITMYWLLAEVSGIRPSSAICWRVTAKATATTSAASAPSFPCRRDAEERPPPCSSSIS